MVVVVVSVGFIMPFFIGEINCGRLFTVLYLAVKFFGHIYLFEATYNSKRTNKQCAAVYGSPYFTFVCLSVGLLLLLLFLQPKKIFIQPHWNLCEVVRSAFILFKCLTSQFPHLNTSKYYCDARRLRDSATEKGKNTKPNQTVSNVVTIIMITFVRSFI